VDPEKIQSALAVITAENDPTVKSLQLASLCTTVWLERGVQLVVVVGSAIEILTEGVYTSGDLDLCPLTSSSLRLRDRQELMGSLSGKGGPRSWQIAGMFVDLLEPVESFARTPFRQIEAPYGTVMIMKPEDLLVERVLVSFYPGPNEEARNCARALATGALNGSMSMDWKEVLRVASLPEYRNLDECKSMVIELANDLKIQNPFDTA